MVCLMKKSCVVIIAYHRQRADLKYITVFGRKSTSTLRNCTVHVTKQPIYGIRGIRPTFRELKQLFDMLYRLFLLV